jgi:hypothetical protein
MCVGLLLRGLGRPAVAAAVTASHPDGLRFGGIGVGVRNREAEPAVLTAKRDRHLSSLTMADLQIRHSLEARGARDYKRKGHTYHPPGGCAYFRHPKGG